VLVLFLGRNIWSSGRAHKVRDLQSLAAARMETSRLDLNNLQPQDLKCDVPLLIVEC
jgi:hypothetical protein